MSKNMANLPTNIDFIRSNFNFVTRNGTIADCIRNGKMNRGNMRVTISYFLPRPMGNASGEKVEWVSGRKLHVS